nr:MAG TPA: hypothetical protein [Caudoviricetes sp.]
MTKEKYKEYINNTRDSALNSITGFHELGNVLAFLSDYIDNCIQLSIDIYEDGDIDYQSYMDLNECINNNLKEVCRIVKNS